jgi:aarF domain-containing kinase
LKELQKLCDSVRPIPDEIAHQLLRDELNVDDLSTVFSDLRLVASASLGQVYQARLLQPLAPSADRLLSAYRRKNSPSVPDQTLGQLVAIKIQRPGMRKSFSLDLFLLQQWAEFVDSFTSIFTRQAPYHRALFDAFAQGSYSVSLRSEWIGSVPSSLSPCDHGFSSKELDYENEARNQKHFQQELRVRGCKVKVPNVYDEYTTQRVLTTEWIEGVKLADSSPKKIRELIPVGVELFLTQLLDIGAFHADPHPGTMNLCGNWQGHTSKFLNILVSTTTCYLDAPLSRSFP